MISLGNFALTRTFQRAKSETLTSGDPVGLMKCEVISNEPEDRIPYANSNYLFVLVKHLKDFPLLELEIVEI